MILENKLSTLPMISYVSPSIYKSSTKNEITKIEIPVAIRLYIADQLNQLKLKYK